VNGLIRLELGKRHEMALRFSVILIDKRKQTAAQAAIDEKRSEA